jgi:hypothetical protein
MTKDELLAELRSVRGDVLTRVEAFPADSWEAGRYEHGWNAREILAHMASIEWAYPRLIDMANEAPERSDSPRGATREGLAQGGVPPQMDDYNARQVAKRADAPIPELIAEYTKNRDAFIAAVEGVDDALLRRIVTSAGGATGPLADVLHFVGVQHIRAHLADLTGEGAAP